MAAFRESVDTDRRIKKRASLIGAVLPGFGATGTGRLPQQSTGIGKAASRRHGATTRVEIA